MSNCYDNAVVESFWGKRKSEMSYHECFHTKTQARTAFSGYIEMFSNRKRLHAAMNYISHNVFEAGTVRQKFGNDILVRSEEDVPVCEEDIIAYLARDLYAEADEWSNSRIRAYIERSQMRD